MSNIDFFESKIEPNKNEDLDPFFTVADKKKEVILDWLKKSVQARELYHQEYFNVCRKNLMAYSGNYFGNKARQTDSLEYLPAKRTSKYSVNHIYEMTENLVSKMTRIKPAVEVLPANDEFEDKNSAKAVTLLMKHLWYINDVDRLLQKVHRHKYIFGNAYLCIKWNPNIGDLHPDYVLLKEKGQLNKLPKGAPVRTGDVDYETILPWNVLVEPLVEYEKTKSVILKENMHIEDLKAKYPEHANALKLSKTVSEFNLSSLKEEVKAKHINVYSFYYKADEHLVEGKKIVFTNDLILEDGELGYSHGDFPIERLTDLDIPGTLNGVSRYQQALILQNAHNNLSQSIMKNEFLMSAPKWVMPRGACKLEQLGNGRTIIQYQGPVAPQMVQMNPTSPTTFNFRDKTEAEIGQIMGVHQVSRGEPPKGITAAVALQFLNEQETERGISDIAKHNVFIVELSKKSIAVAGDYYQIEDGRMLRVLGKENKYMIKYFDSANLHKDYDVRIQNSSALPQSKAARMERILQTMQYAPTLFTPERWAELLEFGSVEKFHTLVSEAISSAESENEDILEGNPVEEPKEWEDIITHLRVHYKKMQARSFKEDVPEDRRNQLILHTKVTEMLAAEKAAVNPLFAAKLSQLEQYPLFFEAEVPASREQQEAIVGGQANRGEEVTGSIAAQEPDSFPGEQTSNKSNK